MDFEGRTPHALLSYLSELMQLSRYTYEHMWRSVLIDYKSQVHDPDPFNVIDGVQVKEAIDNLKLYLMKVYTDSSRTTCTADLQQQVEGSRRHSSNRQNQFQSKVLQDNSTPEYPKR